MNVGREVNRATSAGLNRHIKKRTLIKIIPLIFASYCLLFFTVPVMAEDTPAQVPQPGMVTMVDLGAHSCIPCKMMAPILKKLTSEYEGKAAIVFIDVWQKRSEAKRFKVSMIPTQIFFDKDGNEVFRHQGFMDEEAIIVQLSKMGVQSPPEK